MVDSELLKEFGFEEEEIEMSKSRKGPWQIAKTGFPRPERLYRFVIETYSQSIEESYFWILDHLRQTMGYTEIEKITDLFSASEQSSFFGAVWARIGINQDKASQFLATIGKMTKELFQLVREIRILDERLVYYRDSYSGSASSESAEITLKGIWIDMVEQGAKNPASVYGMARELQFITLPDLFFSVHPQTARDVDVSVDKLEFNRKVKEVLKRKLRTFLEWKESTYQEHKVRRKFTLKYLRQHYDIIHMYMSWAKPYLKNIQRMKMMDKTESPDLLIAFETAMIEIELLAKKLPMILVIDEPPKQNKEVYSCVVAHFDYRTRPSMGYQQEGGQQRGPLHVGRLELSLRAYSWKKEDIKRYLRMKDKEDFGLLSEIDTSVKAAMEALGEELEKYLEEAGESIQYNVKAEVEGLIKKKDKPNTIIDPFASIFKGFFELFGAFAGPRIEGRGKAKKKLDKWQIVQEKKLATEEARKNAWYLYKDYKKVHNMLTW